MHKMHYKIDTSISPTCDRCGIAVGSLSHIFCQCPVKTNFCEGLIQWFSRDLESSMQLDCSIRTCWLCCPVLQTVFFCLYVHQLHVCPSWVRDPSSVAHAEVSLIFPAESVDCINKGQSLCDVIHSFLLPVFEA